MSQKTIVLFAWRRPGYAQQAFEALTRCEGVSDYRVIVSVDGPYPLSESTYLWFRNHADSDITIFRHGRNLGVSGHPKTVLDSLNSEYFVCIEDDCLLGPDALTLADWFFDCHADRYPLLSLGRAAKDGCDGEARNRIRQTPTLESPWAWCFSRNSWNWISSIWDNKTVAPLGWDWSLSYNLAIRKQLALVPYLSRAFNIGREAGTHGTPEWWDEHWFGNKYSADCPPVNPEYFIEPYRGKFIQDWMKPELEQ